MNHPDKPTFEYNEIINGIYIGTNVCCQVHFDERLKAKGILADISLEIERLDAPYGTDYFLWLPVEDKRASSQEQFHLGADAINSLVVLKKKVYVHCKFGHGRSPSLVVAYLIKYQGMSVDEATLLIKEKRPPVHMTDEQITALHKFHKELV